MRGGGREVQRRFEEVWERRREGKANLIHHLIWFDLIFLCSIENRLLVWFHKYEKVNGEVAIKRGNPDLKGMGSTRLQGPWGTWTNYLPMCLYPTPPSFHHTALLHYTLHTLHTLQKLLLLLLFTPIQSLPFATRNNCNSTLYAHLSTSNSFYFSFLFSPPLIRPSLLFLQLFYYKNPTFFMYLHLPFHIF